MTGRQAQATLFRWQRENALLLAAAQVTPADAAIPDPATLDWDYLLRAANRQGITPLLRDWLGQRPALAVPATAQAELDSAYWLSHFRNKTLLAELGRVLDAAAARGIAVVPLKGAILAPHYYPAPALRPMSDLDLLVQPDDIKGLASVLRDLGYSEALGPPYLLDERLRDPLHEERAFTLAHDGLTVLVEYRAEALDPMVWHLTELDPALTASLRHHAARSWRRTTQGQWGTTVFRRPAPEDLLLHIASHLTTRHADFRLLWLHDIARVTAAHADAFDWDAFARAARDLRIAAPVFASLHAARRWAGAPVPLRHLYAALFATPPRQPALQSVERVLLTRRACAAAHTDLAAPPPGELAVQIGSLARLHGIQPRLRALRWALAPGRTYAAGWRGAESSAGYVTTLALRLAIIGLQAVAAGSRRLALPGVPDLADQVIRRLSRAARLDPFAAYNNR